MIDQTPFADKAREHCQSPVLAQAEARLKSPGELLARPGLLCAVQGALVFVEEEIMEPGAVTVWQAAGHLCAGRQPAAALRRAGISQIPVVRHPGRGVYTGQVPGMRLRAVGGILL